MQIPYFATAIPSIPITSACKVNIFTNLAASDRVNGIHSNSPTAQGTTNKSGRRLEGPGGRSGAAPVSRLKSGEPGEQGTTENNRVVTIRSGNWGGPSGSRSVPTRISHGVDGDAETQGTVNSPHRQPRNVPDPQLSLVFYGEDILLMPDEEVGHARWVAFLTLVHGQGGHYRQRSSVPAAYGGFSDVWQCDARFANGSRVVVSRKALYRSLVSI